MISRALHAWRLPLLPLLALIGGSGCDFGSEAAFIDGRSLDRCNQSIPVCSTTAGCRLVEEDQYLEGRFPGFRQMIVPTAAEAVITVEIYWRTQLSPGADTEILWYEPACVDAYHYESAGLDVFAASKDGVLIERQHVFRGGDHLVEVRSDATGEYVMRTTVQTPEEFEATQSEGFGF